MADISIIRGDARNLPLPDESVDLVVTSPPYFALRSYSDGGEHYAGQVGSEATPAEFIEALLDCTREMVRVLKPTGSIWVNLGDKYNSAASGQNLDGFQERIRERLPHVNVPGPKRYAGSRGRTASGIRNKSLMLLPERYRIACVDQLGLIARAVVIWSKPNGLPESVTDRVRRSHEDWVHLTKQPRYFAAVDEIREPHEHHRRDSWDRRPAQLANGIRPTGSVDARVGNNPLGKLPGSVWEIATQPLTVPAELGIDHFAAFPMEWPRRIILGWSPSGICVACGEGRRPVAVRDAIDPRHLETNSRQDTHERLAIRGVSASSILRTGLQSGQSPATHITGYSCACPEPTAPTEPAVVLDPFGGTGTTALMADVLGRHGISVDMSADYCRLAQWRTGDQKQRERAQRPPKPPKPRPAPVTPSTPAEWLAHFGINA